MDDLAIKQSLAAAVRAGDLVTARSLLSANPDLASHKKMFAQRLYYAASKNNVPMMALLVEFGADVNTPMMPTTGPEGAIAAAAVDGATEAVRWLLEQGANINFVVGGERRCFPLTHAITGGHFEVVKLLVEHGADINAAWRGQNALTFARMYQKHDIEAYLLSIGAREPLNKSQIPHHSAYEEELRTHIETHIGPLELLSIQAIVPSDPSVAIDYVKLADRVVLITRGMSSKPMNVPPGSEIFARAELCISLPPDWPLGEISDPRYAWPVKWLKQIAIYPHANRTWLGGPAVIIANGDPPIPLAPNTNLSCLLLYAAANAFSRATLRDGTTVQFYSLWPLYTEERDFERTAGMATLLALLKKEHVGSTVNLDRPNVAPSTR